MSRIPVIFFYINDLPQAVQSSTNSMYAVDTSLPYQSDDIHQLNEAMNKYPTTVLQWLRGNKLSLNVSKTHKHLLSQQNKRKDVWLEITLFLAKLLSLCFVNKDLSLNFQEA